MSTQQRKRIGSAKAEGLPRPHKVPKERPGPIDGKRAQNRRRRTEQIGAAALELFLDRGIAAVSIDEIVQRAGIAKGSFYRYFEDKRDLVEGIIEPLAATLRRALDVCARATDSAQSSAQLVAAYTALGAELAQAIAAYRDAVRLFLQESRGPGIGAREPIRALDAYIERQTLALTERACEHGLLRSANPQVSSLVVIGAVERIAFGLLSGRTPSEPAEIAIALVAIILDGLRAKE